MRRLLVSWLVLCALAGMAAAEPSPAAARAAAQPGAAASPPATGAAETKTAQLAAGAAAPKQLSRAEMAKVLCALIEDSASANDLPVEYFTRLIWKESAFRADAVSPKGAQGIAQFMPGTAAERGLADPFNPAEAIPASAAFLKDLAAQFGNLGLAAAAYNSSARRVQEWLDGTGGLPWETQDYVLAITGRAAADWASPELQKLAAKAEQKEVNCIELAALLAKPGAMPKASPGGGGAPQRVWSPWGVQVAGNFSADRALAAYAALQRKHAAVLGGKSPMVVSEKSRSRGARALTHVRVPAQSRKEADDLCAKLRAAGGACVVLKN